MDKLKLFLNGKMAIVINNENDFNDLRTYLSINNIFLENGDPVSKMKYPNLSSFIIFIKQNVVYSKALVDVDDAMKNRCIKYTSVSNDINSNISIQPSIFDGAVNEVHEDEPLDVEVKEEVIETELPVFKADAETSKIISNIEHFKMVVIPKIIAKSNLVVTEDNLQFAKKEVANLNNIKKQMNNDKKDIKDKILAEFNEFEKDCKFIADEIDTAVKKINSNIQVFEDETVSKRKKEKMAYIFEELDKAVKENKFTKDYVDKFVSNEKWWINKTFKITQFKDEVAKEIERLEKEYQAVQNAYKSIRDFISVQCKSNGIEILKADNYIRLLDHGVDIADVMNTITNDIQNILANIEKAKNQALEQQKQKEEQVIQQNQNVSSGGNTKPTYAFDEVENINVDENVIHQEIAGTPEKYKGVMYEYTFKIRGSFGLIKTVSLFLNKMMELTSLQFEKLSGGKING